MKTYEVHVPVKGYLEFQVEAESREDAHLLDLSGILKNVLFKSYESMKIPF